MTAPHRTPRLGRDFLRVEAECRAALDAACAARTMHSGRGIAVLGRTPKVRTPPPPAPHGRDVAFVCAGCQQPATGYHPGRGPLPDRCDGCVDPTTKRRRQDAAAKRRQRVRQMADAAARRARLEAVRSTTPAEGRCSIGS